jgi:hypothetical protein
MRAIKYEGVIDVSGYPAYLHKIAALLPARALSFAQDEGHYNFYGKRCTHDLSFGHIAITNSGQMSYTLFLNKSPFKHEQNLSIHYYGVIEFKINRLKEDCENTIDDLIIDEISLDDSELFVRHEIQFWGAEIIVICRDLEAQWK